MTKNFLEIDNVTFTASAQNKVSNVSLTIENQGDIICYWVHLELVKLQSLEQ